VMHNTPTSSPPVSVEGGRGSGGHTEILRIDRGSSACRSSGSRRPSPVVTAPRSTALAAISAAAASGRNLMPLLIDAARAGLSEGEIVQSLQQVWGAIVRCRSPDAAPSDPRAARASVLDTARWMMHNTWHMVGDSSLVSAIANHACRPVDATPATTVAALKRLEPLRSVRDALAAVGLDHVVSIRRTESPVGVANALTGFVVEWPLPSSGKAHINWTASVEMAGDGRSMLSVSVRADTDDPAARKELVAAWPLIGPVIDSETGRVFRAVTELAEQFDENAAVTGS
jgi:hypothetical protein